MNKDMRLIIFFISIVILFFKSNSYYSSAIEKNWGIVIPPFSFSKEIYAKDNGPSFLGDGIRYHIFSYKSNNYIESWLRWENKEGKTRYYSTYSDTVKAWLEEIEIEEKLYPDFDKCLYYYEEDMRDEIIILWNKNEKKFYVIESFM